MKILPMGAELFHVDWRTDMVKLTVAFRNFANAPKNTSLQNNVFLGQNLFLKQLQIIYIKNQRDATWQYVY